MKVITKEGFKLPFMGKDKFVELMKIGIGYNRQLSVFYVSEVDRIEQIKSILSEILGDEVTFFQTCFLCNKAFPCSKCKFAANCKTRDIPLFCICRECFSDHAVYERYTEKNSELAKKLYDKR
ncbi:MAG: hypothetical protein ABIH76_01110 [Candidatus Bathyarchaeota archaeon]